MDVDLTILSAVLDLFGFNQFMSHGLPWWLSGKESTCQCRRCGSDPWVGTIPLEKETAIHSNTLAWEIPDRGAWKGYGVWSHKESGTIQGLKNSNSLRHVLGLGHSSKSVPCSPPSRFNSCMTPAVTFILLEGVRDSF